MLTLTSRALPARPLSSIRRYAPFLLSVTRSLTFDKSAIHRCAFPSPHRVYFSDVVFADIFTSFAKVLGDVWLSICMFLPGNSLLDVPTISGWQKWILPTIMR